MSTSWLQQFCPVKSGKNVDAKGVCPIPKMTQKVNSTETIDSSSNESGCPIKTHCDSKTASAKPEDCGSGDGCPVKSTTKVIPEGCPVKSTSSEGCPVKSNTKDIPDGCPKKTTTKTIPEGCPVKNDNPLHNQHEGCPVKHNGDELKYNAIANDIEYNQKPSVGQKSPLSVAREESNIPKGSFTPSHQPVNAEKWVYPSQQQYFNAMKRKGYDPKENEIPAVLAIHNTVNEQGWSKIVEWERLRGNEAPKLKSFCGRPKDFSPRARWNMMWGDTAPFDRHDWVIERDGKEVRYVIDFYTGNSYKRGAPMSIFLDVRPALDSPSALYDQLSYKFRTLFMPYSVPKSTLLGSRTEYGTLAGKYNQPKR